MTIVTYKEIEILALQARNQNTDMLVQLSDGQILPIGAKEIDSYSWFYEHFGEELGRAYYRKECYGSDWVPSCTGHFQRECYSFTKKLSVVDAAI